MRTIVLIITLIFQSCSFGSSAFNEVKINDQTWMSENLNTAAFRNGDPIKQIQSKDEWEVASNKKQPAWCYYNNDPEYGKRYGKLYNWYAVNDPRGLAPEGWHVASKQEWLSLIENFGGKNEAGIKLKAKDGWNMSLEATNSSKFTALPGGIREYWGNFLVLGFVGKWWCSSGDERLSKSLSHSISMESNSPLVEFHDSNQGYGFSVRCIKD
jgi:uncharacterized protein (TIGR02145 family)